MLYTSALRMDELDAKLLPLYEKYNIKHDIYTYQYLSKMYLNLREFNLIKSLYMKIKQ